NLMKLFDGTRTRQEILAEYNAPFAPEDHLNFQFLLDLEDSLVGEKLMQLSTAQRSLGLLKDDRRRRAAKKAEGVNVMYMMFKVWDPDRFLNRTWRYVRWLWTPPAVAVVMTLGFFTFWVFASHWSTIFAETLDTWAFLRKPFWGIVQFWTIFTV